MGPKKFPFPIPIPGLKPKSNDDSSTPQNDSNATGTGTKKALWNPLSSLQNHKDSAPSGKNAQNKPTQSGSPKSKQDPVGQRYGSSSTQVAEKLTSPQPASSSASAEILPANVNSSSGASSEIQESGFSSQNSQYNQNLGPAPLPRNWTDSSSVSSSLVSGAFSRSRLTLKAFRELQPLTYSWSDINVYTKPKHTLFDCKKVHNVKCILRNVTGIAHPGKLLALMGSSGAGKSSLLNVLTCRTCRQLNVTGEICINGVPVDRDMLASIGAYVQQSDFLVGSLTPREHLQFQAALRMDQRIPFKIRMERVEEVIIEMGLSNCADVLIGIPGRLKGLSGGQQKRLSIASELLTDPGILFLDEPTTGLDFFMASSLVKLLKEMAVNGKTIICTIHQPASGVYSLFDRLCLLSEGRTAFIGDCADALPFFNEQGYPCPLDYNPADFFIHTLCIRPGMEEIGHERSQAICDSFDKSDRAKFVYEAAEDNRMFGNYPKDAVDARSRRKPSCATQLKALFWRSCKTIFRDPLVLQIQIGQMILLAFVLGAIFYNKADEYDQESVQDISGFFFLVLANLTWASVFSVANVFWGEIDVFIKEYYDGTYRLDTYYISKILAEIPVYTLLPCIFMGIAYWLVGLTLLCERFMTAMAIAILISNISTGVGYLISLSTPSLQACLLLAPAFLLPFVLVGGHFVNKDSIPVYLDWLKHVSWFLYGFEAFSINQWEDVTSISCEAGPKMPCIIKNGKDALKSLSFKQDDFHFSILMLCVLLVGFRLLAFCSLWIKVKKQL